MMSNKFQKGERVEIIKQESPYYGYVGTIVNAWWAPLRDNATGYNVKVESFGSAVIVSVDEDELIAAEPDDPE